MWGWGHMGAWGMVWGWLFMALLLAALIVLVVVLVRMPSGRDSRSTRRPSGRSRAREVLDERYARGEIDSAEYDERRRRLEDDLEP
jgi:putative membrane protein